LSYSGVPKSKSVILASSVLQDHSALAIGELGDLLGVPKAGHGFVGKLVQTVVHLGETHWTTLGIALGSLVMILAFEKMAP
jgi:MFS superfamily sulfate permease-like transporter